jgi:hypothetical protein
MLLCRVAKEVLEAVVALQAGIQLRDMGVKEALDKDKTSRIMDMARAKEVIVAGEEAILGEGGEAGETGKLLRVNQALAAFRA